MPRATHTLLSLYIVPNTLFMTTSKHATIPMADHEKHCAISLLKLLPHIALGLLSASNHNN